MEAWRVREERRVRQGIEMGMEEKEKGNGREIENGWQNGKDEETGVLDVGVGEMGREDKDGYFEISVSESLHFSF